VQYDRLGTAAVADGFLDRGDTRNNCDGLAQLWQPLRRQLVGWQVNHMSERVLTRSLPSRSHDVIFSIVIEVTLMKR
jgi:hypothetical protein